MRVCLVLLVAACEPAPFRATVCNGSAALCDRRFTEAAFATTHNAFSTLAGNFGAPNQTNDMPKQLRDGVRGMMLDLHAFEGETQLCHGLCQIGAQPAREGLAQLRQFLDENRGETLTLILESYVSAADINDAFAGSGLLSYVYSHAGTWPTLRELIERNTRVVVLTDEGGGEFPWLLPAYTVAWDNPYAVESYNGFSCVVNRGRVTNDLFILNHFITRTVSNKSDAEIVNQKDSLGAHATRCKNETGRFPNFVTVDWYDTGDLFDVVRELNGL